MCPPGVDQTCRSQQQWHLLAPLLKEKYDLTKDFKNPHLYGTSPQSFILGDYSFDAFDRLFVSTARSSRPKSLRSSPLSQDLVIGDSTLERLPPELLNMIIVDHDLDAKDLISLGLCSQSLWPVVLDHISKQARQKSWIDTPLILTGTYLTTVPDSILALAPRVAQEEHAIRTLLQRSPRGYYRRGMPPARHWNWDAIGDYEEVSSSTESWIQHFKAAAPSSRLHPRDLTALRQSLVKTLQHHSSSAAATTKYVLHNLTTREYVSLKRSHRLKAEKNYLHVTGAPWLSLDKALALRICWGSVGSGENVPGHHTAIAQGGWAGHRFDVVPYAEAGLIGNWTDVTRDIVKEGKAFM